MVQRDDLPPTPDWQMPRRCCATWTDDLVCGVCFSWTRTETPTHIWLGEN